MNDLKNDINSLLPCTTLFDAGVRRDFIKTVLGTGFAAAVLPVCAQTMVKTDSAGLTAGEVSIMVNGQAVPAYRAYPQGQTNLPVVLVLSEIFGVHEYIADVVRRLAQQGYLAIAPDLFVRQGNPARYSTITELNQAIISKVPDQQVLGDIDAYVAWAKDHHGNIDKLGITGFCWGGRFVWLYSGHNPNVKAGVAWYGRLVGDKNPLMPQHPIDIGADLKVPVLGLYGGKDGGIPISTVEQMQNILRQSGNQSQFVVYPEAGHAFHADYRSSYVESAAKDGWQRTLAWFKEHGVR